MTQKTALLSVFHKDGIADFARELVALNYRIIASGGTKRALEEAGIAAEDTAAFVGGQAILGHRVVTISREIAAGLLATESDRAELTQLGIQWIDLVCVDLYPLQEAIAKPEADLELVIESTDIGGPLLLRAAAKGRRVVVCETADRARVIAWLKASEPEREQFIRGLAAKAEGVVAGYALLSARFLSEGGIDGVTGAKIADCLYGENPWQKAFGLFATAGAEDDPLALANFVPAGGTTPSYNNFGDIDRCLQTITHLGAAWAINFSEEKNVRMAVGVKHGNPCGVAIGDTAEAALTGMVSGNPLAIFGGVVMVNFPLTAADAEILLTHGMESSKKRVLDAVLAPRFDEGAIAVLTRKKTQKCRMLANPALAQIGVKSLDRAVRRRYVRGGFLAQGNYTFVLSRRDADVAVYGDISEQQWRDVILAWAVGATSNSNTMTITQNNMVLANGVGQQARVTAAKLAVMLARDSGHDLAESVAYSDSFFPFIDGPEVLTAAGVRTIITSSGSVADADVIAFCKEKNITLVMITDKIARGFFGH